MRGWFEADRLVDIRDADGRVVGQLAPGHRYEAQEVAGDSLVILGPGGAPGYVAARDVRLVSAGAGAGTATPVQALPVVPGAAPQPRGRPRGRVPMIVISVALLVVWIVDVNLNSGLPGYWGVVPAVAVVTFVCGVVARPWAGFLATLAFTAATLAALAQAAELSAFYEEEGVPPVETFVDNLDLVAGIPLVFVLAFSGMIVGGVMARGARD